VIYRNFGKRFLDVILSGLGLLLLSPVFLIVSVLVLISMGPPILFTQVRPGLNASLFQMIKFRTMKHLNDSKGQPLPDEERVTKLGKFLRSTSLDELPELVNVFLGHMSIVGPRPLLVEYLPLYSIEQFRRHEVKPGITGLAQVNGRNILNWDQRLAYDLEYIKKISFWQDILILIKTISVVLSRKNVEYQTTNEYSKFKGNDH
jgi:undecaprenyl phosphate N,N'-diacetylbacillosamine 1-phosphate transferase